MFNLSQRTVVFAVLFVIPLLGFTYWDLVIASYRYQTETSIVISQENSGTTTFNLSFLGLPATADDKDALSVVEFIISRDMLHYLDEKLHLRDHYSSSRIDWLNRFSNTGSFEEFHNYMTNWLVVYYDTASKIIHVQLQTFDANYSKAVVDAILTKSQEFIDHLNATVTAEQTRFFEEKMVESETRLKQAKQALLTFQRTNRLLTTASESSVVLTDISALETQLGKNKSEFGSLANTLTPDAPRLQQMKSDIESLEAQISIEKDRLSGASTASISELDARSRDILLNLELVTLMYASNMSQLEQARNEAARLTKFLVTIGVPSIADSAQYPKQFYEVAVAAVLLISMFFIVDIMLSIIREHAI